MNEKLNCQLKTEKAIDEKFWFFYLQAEKHYSSNWNGGNNVSNMLDLIQVYNLYYVEMI